MMKKYIPLLLILFTLAITNYSCKEEAVEKKETAKTKKPVKALKIPAFSGDSAYVFVENQLAFGHRIPGTPEHKACQDWIADKLRSYGAEVTIQPFKAKIYTGEVWDAANIIGSVNPQAKERLIIAAHYDTRHIAEKDPDESMRDKPIMGADDGASGVAVVLELARQVYENPIDMGIDFILFDAEDNGNADDTDSWCLGSQHWSREAVKNRYRADAGILLDLVGAKGAVYPKEYFSQRFAPQLHNKVWSLAIAMGYGDLFLDQQRGAVNDDHYHVNLITGIPMIDIINLPKPDGSFGDYHHTHKDDIDIIDKNVLRKTGQVVTAVIYRMDAGKF
jgi:glutaminyl-peptide cyclotransferase